MQLSQDIRNNYYDHLQELSAHKQFHFCTRLAAWEGDQKALHHLRTLQPLFSPVPYTKDEMRTELATILSSPPAVVANAHQLRAAYFDKYPTLRSIDNALFRVRHLLAVYGIDTRDILLELVSRDELLALKTALMADSEATRILSTYVVNFIYLLERVVLEHDSPESIDIDHLRALGSGYDDTDRAHLQLHIYLYTHCVIGETNFYTRKIPEALVPAYQRIVEDLEALITDNYDRINLDNKLEFLVCCRIVGYTSQVSDRIYQECDASVSDEGMFLVDRHNANAQSDRSDLGGSEHRNVLYIMSLTAYSPRATRV